MAIVFQSDNFILLNHKEIVDSHYQGKYEIRREFFNINRSFKSDNTAGVKRKRRKMSTHEKNVLLEESLQKFIHKCKLAGYFEENGNEESNQASLEEASKVHNLKCSYPVLRGENNNNECIITKLQEEEYLFPPQCRFFQNDVKKIDDFLSSGEVFDLIVIDPPWWNKYIRRVKKANRNISYDMLYNDEIADIPVGRLNSTCSIVTIWCTNNKTHLNSIMTKFIPHWKLRYVAEWLWMKVTKVGKPVCDFADEEKKQPYERIIVAVKDSEETKCLSEKIPKDIILVSTPSSIHSHKPPLSDILKLYLPENPKCLEIFARYLQPGFTSVGLEVLKLQHVSLFNRL
ncbi:N(6)-adenine-specific methyltransferase METTL4 [Sergentomyia squamirostris]